MIHIAVPRLTSSSPRSLEARALQLAKPLEYLYSPCRPGERTALRAFISTVWTGVTTSQTGESQTVAVSIASAVKDARWSIWRAEDVSGMRLPLTSRPRWSFQVDKDQCLQHDILLLVRAL